MASCNLRSEFFRYFKPVYANNPELLRKVYQIRHQVFAEELGFEPRNAQRLECDEYDAHSYHYLLHHGTRNEYAGTARLIVSPPDNRDFKLPFERFCSHGIDSDLLDMSALEPGTYAEVSRLAVPEAFRRRKGEQGTTVGVPEQDKQGSHQRSQYALIPIGLYLVATALCMNLGIERAFVMAEPRLARHLSRFGIKFVQAGPPIEYHGRRALYYITYDDFMNNVKPEIRELLDDMLVLVDNDVAGINNQLLPSALAL